MRVPIAVLALLFVLGCSDESTPDVDTAPVETQAATDDQAIAEAALLTIDDVPTGWTEVAAPDESDDVVAARQQVRACYGSGSGGPIDFGGAQASTGEFASPDDESVAHDVAIGDEQRAKDLMAGLADDSVAGCLESAFPELLELALADQDLQVGEVTVGRLSVAPAGDEVVAYRLDITVIAGDEPVDVFSDLVVVRVGRGLSALQFQSSLLPFSSTGIDDYVALTTDRLRDALADAS